MNDTGAGGAKGTALVLGAGIVGVCAALRLAEDGWRVMLLDRGEPLQDASRWNAGVLATSSLVPINAPGLVARLPALLTGRVPGFRLGPSVGPRMLPWALAFLAGSRASAFEPTVAALNALIVLSGSQHRQWLAACGAADLLSEQGWLHLYETAAALEQQSSTLAVYRRHEVAHRVIDAEELAELEPHLAPRFGAAVHLTGSAAVSEPRAAGLAYLGRFRDLGGQVVRTSVAELTRTDGQIVAQSDDGRSWQADRIVLAAGVGSARLLATLGKRLPMVAERGYARRFALRGNAVLRRPVYDTAGGIVLSPRPDGVQISTGSELNRPGHTGHGAQIAPALARAGTVLPLGDEVTTARGQGERPTLPDSRPAIGPVMGCPGLWLCCGHQHLGFNTAPGSAAVLADLIAGRPPAIDPAPFAPERFRL